MRLAAVSSPGGTGRAAGCRYARRGGGRGIRRRMLRRAARGPRHGEGGVPAARRGWGVRGERCWTGAGRTTARSPARDPAAITGIVGARAARSAGSFVVGVRTTRQVASLQYTGEISNDAEDASWQHREERSNRRGQPQRVQWARTNAAAPAGVSKGPVAAAAVGTEPSARLCLGLRRPSPKWSAPPPPKAAAKTEAAAANTAPSSCVAADAVVVVMSQRSFGPFAVGWGVWGVTVLDRRGEGDSEISRTRSRSNHRHRGGQGCAKRQLLQK
jgi:hypothetical protein